MHTSLSAFDLARLQFAFTVSFHIVFPALSIGLASFIAVLEGCWLRTRQPFYKDLCLFWSKVFAVAFGMGVVSGVVMSYEFGTNWAGFSSFAGPVTGPLLMYEVMTAFFLEAGFLGIMLFGWNRVSPRAHFGATLMVAVGTLISTFWILASNSWMQTPQGFEIIDGRVVPTDWFKIIFNPSFPYRLAHMAIAAFIVAALVVAASGAWHLLKGRRDPAIKKMFSMALGLLLVLAPVQAFVGDAHGLNTREYQPAKIAAIEGLWDTEQGGTALNLFGIPDMQAETTRYAVSVPHLGSLILTHSWDGEIKGLKSFPADERPNSLILFWSFRVMVGLGILMIALGVTGWVLRRRGTLYESRGFQRFALAMGPTGFITLLAGWVTTEAGRQPWVIYGVMRTAQAVSPLTAQQVGVSLMAFVAVYFLVFGTGIYYLLKLLRTGPALPGETPHEPHEPHEPRLARPALAANQAARRPMSAADQLIDAEAPRIHRYEASKQMDVTVIWAAIIALGVLLYVVLDGFDLGIGIVFPLFPDEEERDLMMNTVAPVWDGNETWLVLGGAGLFAVFPVVYSTVLSALYLPLVFMLACLIFRGVSFEVRAKANRTKHLWDLAFIGGSTGAAFFQGIALGAFLQGIPIDDGRFAGDAFGWLTPFSLLSGFGLVATYALLGCCWLVAKTEGDLQRRLHKLVWPLTVMLLGFIALVSLWTPLQDPAIAERWFGSGLFWRLAPVPLLVLACAAWMRWAVHARHHKTPFIAAIGLVLLGYAGLLVSLWPYAIPQSLTLWEAAAPRESQVFTLAGAAFILPVILAYTALSYWVFRGKVRHGDTHHYH